MSQNCLAFDRLLVDSLDCIRKDSAFWFHCAVNEFVRMKATLANCNQISMTTDGWIMDINILCSGDGTRTQQTHLRLVCFAKQ